MVSDLKAPQRGERPFDLGFVHDRHRYRNERKTGLVGERIYALSVKRDEEALNERPIGGLGNLLHEKVSALPNGSRLSCGRTTRRRKTGERQTKTLTSRPKRLN